MYLITAIGIFLVIYIIYNVIHTYSEVTYIKSDIDDSIYMIRRGNNKSQKFLIESANTLALINQRIEKLICHLNDNFSNDNSKNFFIKKLTKNYNRYMISEAAIDPRYTTYTVDKKDMHICLRTRDKSEKIYDINILMYVCLHESSHLCNYTKSGDAIQGHGDEFRYIFKFLIEESIKIGTYEYVNYEKSPEEYCNITINSSII